MTSVAQEPKATSQPSNDAVPMQFGAHEATLSGMQGPSGAAIDRDGLIYVIEREAHRVRVFRRDGEQVRSWGEFGSDPGQFQLPTGIALGPDGRVYVADAGNHRMQVFEPDGAFVRTWGGYGVEPGSFNGPCGIAVSSEAVVVADAENHRVQVFAADGRLLRVIGGYGVEPRRMNRPTGVALDAQGAIYVCDADNSRIQKFSADGVLLTSWGSWGFAAAQLAEPRGIAYHRERVYVADMRNHRIQAFDSAGERLYQWGLHAIRPREGQGKLHYPDAIAIAPSGAFAVVAEWFENRCQIFALETPEAATARFNPLVGGNLASPHFGQRVDIARETMVLAEPDSHSLLVFDLRRTTPILVHRFGGPGTGAGQFLRPEGLDLSADGGRLAVCDTGNRRLVEYAFARDDDELKFRPNLSRMVRAVDLGAISRRVPVLGAGQVLEATALERDADGNLYVLDARNCLIVVFDSKLKYLRSWGGYGREAGRFRGPTDLALTSDGRTLYVVDSLNHRVQAFDREGQSKRMWGRRGTDDGSFARPFGIAVAADGSVLVTDAGLHRVQVFDAQGQFVRKWGRQGIGAGEFFRPRGIAIDARGRVFVIDWGNHRGQIFSIDGTFQHAFGSRLFVQPARKPKSERS